MKLRTALLPLLMAAAGCGGGGGGSPTQPTLPTDPPGETVTAVVFYDENGNGQLDPSEQGRVPDVEVTIAGRTARAEKLTGRVTVRGVPTGSHTMTVMPGTLPPYYTPGIGRTLTVPQDAAQPPPGVGARLEIGDNRPSVYMAFGDSITKGDGDPAGIGYPGRLEARLRAHFGDGAVVNRGADGTNSGEGVERILRNLRGSSPAFTLVLYGTNDWNEVPCQDVPPCDVVKNLRLILDEAKSAHSLPFLATLAPVNPSLAAADRNDWIIATNDRIKQLGREEGVFVVDLFEAFRRQGGDVSRFFTDHVHPNAAGYEVIAEGFFQAIAFGRAVPTTSSRGLASLLHRPS
jgi:lysophospholipase L1-like esterase